MASNTDRIQSSAELGRAHMGWDVGLGLLALLPLLGCAVLAFDPNFPRGTVARAAVTWCACLIAFFAGVRRGLTFSERGGARLSELATMLGLFAVAVASLLAASAALAALGLVAVAVLDAVAARRGQAPGYMTLFRPIQLAVGAICMLVVQARL